MDDLVRQVEDILRAMWKHRWFGVAVAWAVAAIGVAVVVNVPDKYMATARIYVDTQSILKPLMAELAVQPNVDQQIAMLGQTLINRPNIEKLVRRASAEWSGKSGVSQDELVDRIIRNLEIKSASLDNLYTLAYRDPDPDRAKWVVQAVASFFVETTLGENRKDSAAAKKFIDGQIRIYEKKLLEAESRLKAFKLRHIDLRLADGRGGIDPLAEIGALLDKARLDWREAESARDALRRQIVGDESAPLSYYAPWTNGGMPISELEGRIDKEKKSLDTLLQQYTEQHPDVIAARRLIGELEEQRRKEIAERKMMAAANPHSIMSIGSPVDQRLRVAYAEAEAKVASLAARVAEYESRYRQIRQAQKAEPQIEAEFAQLNRDYDVHKKNYEALVARRESASLASELESAGFDDFKLVDPPRVSPKPVSPNRLLLLPLVLLMALGAGGFASYAASQIRPVFFDLRSLRQVTGQPLLGCISLVDVGGSVGRQKRSDMRRFAVALGGLVGAFSIGLFIVFAMSRNAV